MSTNETNTASRERIYILLPGLLWRTGIQQLAEEKKKPKLLNKVLSRALVRSTGVHSLNESIFKQFGIDRKSEGDLPIAAVSLYGLDHEVDDNTCWGCAWPIHLVADRDSLILLKLGDPGNHPLTENQTDLLITHFNQHFQEDGIKLYAANPQNWYVELSNCPSMQTFDIDQVAGKHIGKYFPQGRDGSRFRSLLNEIQMLLFDAGKIEVGSGVDRQKINGIWLSGFGKIPKVSTAYAKCYSNMPLMRGLAKLSSIYCESIPERLSSIAQVKGDQLVLISDLLDYEVAGDIHGWMEYTMHLSGRIGSLLSDLKFANHQEIVIDTCNGKSFYITNRSYYFKCYKKSKNLHSFIDS